MTELQLRAPADRIIVSRIPTSDKTVDGIILPGNSAEVQGRACMIGIVLRVGDRVAALTEPSGRQSIQPGDKVLMTPHLLAKPMDWWVGLAGGREMIDGLRREFDLPEKPDLFSLYAGDAGRHQFVGDVLGIIRTVAGKTTLTPLQDRLLVRRLAPAEKSLGGIAIPNQSQQLPDEGDVVAVGSGSIMQDGRTRPLDVKVGDRILFSRYGGSAIMLDGVEYLIMREDSCLSITREAFEVSAS